MADDTIIGTILINHVNPEKAPYTHWVTYSAPSFANLTTEQYERLCEDGEKMFKTDPNLECTIQLAAPFALYERMRDSDHGAGVCPVCNPNH